MVAAPRVRHQSEPGNSGPVSSPTYASIRLAPPSPGVNWSLIAQSAARSRHSAADAGIPWLAARRLARLLSGLPECIECILVGIVPAHFGDAALFYLHEL